MKTSGVAIRLDESELAYIDNIVKNNGFKNRGEYIKFACIHSGGIAKNLYLIREWLREQKIIE